MKNKLNWLILVGFFLGFFCSITVLAQNDDFELKKTEIISPGKKWVWYNSWHLVRRQPGFILPDVGHGPYTLYGSFSNYDSKEYFWAYYCYYLFEGELDERNGGNSYFREIEKKIYKKRRQVANIIRVDKLSPRKYVVTYRRNINAYHSLHRYFRRTTDYPFFNFSSQISFSDKGIRFLAKVAQSWRGETIYRDEITEIPIKDVLLLNPQYFQNPTELEKIFIPFSYFDKKLIYLHPAIKNRGEEPMMIRIGPQGIRVYFKKGGIIRKF